MKKGEQIKLTPWCQAFFSQLVGDEKWNASDCNYN